MAKIWFVTGSNKGLGLAIVEAALQDGDIVVATARNPEALKPLVEKYGSDRVLTLALDVSKNDQVESAVKAAVEKFGRLDVVVNNAGYADIATLEDSSLESFRAQTDTNFFGTVYVTKAVAPILRKQGSGHILQVSSVGGRLATPGLSAYQSAKWAVGGFSTAVSQELAPFNVKVTVLEPGGIKTDWAATAWKGATVSEPYQESIAKFKALEEEYAHLASDPAKLATTILKITKVPEPPLRLLLGPDAAQIGKKISDDLAASDEKWKAASLLSL